MAVYLFAQFARSSSQLTGQKTTKSEEVCDQAAHTVTWGPMLCILFLGARLRALQMHLINGAPQRWARNCTYMGAYALLENALLAILVPLVMNGEASLDDKGLGDFDYEVKHKMFGTALTIFRYGVSLSIYGGFVAVICSIFTPAAAPVHGEAPPAAAPEAGRPLSHPGGRLPQPRTRPSGRRPPTCSARDNSSTARCSRSWRGAGPRTRSRT